jgi:hypothetical protein
MRIPVFVSCASKLNSTQEASRRIVAAELEKLDLEWRALGRTDYPTALPLKEVFGISRHCAGGIILGFEQIYAARATKKRGTPEQGPIVRLAVPTAWNHLEAGILFSLGLPLLVFKEDGIHDGIFDNGVTDVFVHRMPRPRLSREDRHALSAVFLKWHSAVSRRYYDDEEPMRFPK